jgi:hypothetical protein
LGSSANCLNQEGIRRLKLKGRETKMPLCACEYILFKAPRGTTVIIGPARNSWIDKGFRMRVLKRLDNSILKKGLQHNPLQSLLISGRR